MTKNKRIVIVKYTMPAQKKKKPQKKVVSRARKSTSSLGPVHFVMIGVTAAVVVAGYLFYQQNVQSPSSPKNELKQTVNVEKTKFESKDKMDADSSDEEQTSDSIILEEQDDSNQSGTVMLGESDGKATVSVRILGSSEKAQSAHIHNGSCAYPGAVKYPLTTLADGSSKTTLDISQQQLLWGLPLAVIVHASATDETVVACGDLSY
ncbi:MAG: hypothetical protein KA477_00385 [Candidatus Levybacteria bacterium]|nr:hypothetical protein [Candidatus Levybacteria bacterium]